MNPTQLSAPEDLSDWLAAGDRAAELSAESVAVDAQWWSEALAEFDLPNPLLGNEIGRRDLFGLGSVAADSPDDAIALLWNVIAFCLGRRNSDGRKRIAAVAADRKRIGRLLQEAALAAREDPGAAFAMLRPDKGGNVIERLGPAGFTWYLYFAGAGDPEHPSPVLETKVARSLRRAGWKGLRDSTWTAADYVVYSKLVDRWRIELGVDRNDVVVNGLFAITPPTGWDHPWQAWERQTWEKANWVRGPLSTDDLRTVHRWLRTFSALAPRSAEAQSEFRDLGKKINAALDGEPGEIHDGFDDEHVYGGHLGRRF
ncbi:8-oxoguanine DNA glycosylase OGG fold protein [Gordonia paraffinivorans]|uniref:Uncharacterized protein n=1 Tax=Gordonia paraffinivorans NBRC 108238 TaxID=1223543 RepID=A0ABQ0INF3_9ACTN|nr:hypothetical protein [Gordonia paraffinivorans]MBY4572770.1 hypothetical protein [Gordonia paraffinivorans]GAC84933.1 hypothetical protein GP2_027_00780 [Gordonia paraffinivorans NBRC 108238]